MLAKRLFHTAALIFALASGSKANSLNYLVCHVTNEAAAAFDGISGSLCEKLAEALSAKAITQDEMHARTARPAADGVPAHYHRLYAVVVSDRKITFQYAFGTAKQWREKNEMRFDDLQFETMDTKLSETALTGLVETLANIGR